MTMTKQKL